MTVKNIPILDVVIMWLYDQWFVYIYVVSMFTGFDTLCNTICGNIIAEDKRW